MKKILILSDTHCRKHRLDQKIIDAVKNYEYVIHAGDYTNDEIMNELTNTGKFTGVAGNNDSWMVHNSLGSKKIIEIEEIKIGICHGDGFWMGAFENSVKTFQNDKLDLVIFGHSHKSMIKKEGSTIYLNPGSPTQPRGGQDGSVAEVLIDGREIHTNIVFI